MADRGGGSGSLEDALDAAGLLKPEYSNAYLSQAWEFSIEDPRIEGTREALHSLAAIAVDAARLALANVTEDEEDALAGVVMQTRSSEDARWDREGTDAERGRRNKQAQVRYFLGEVLTKRVASATETSSRVDAAGVAVMALAIGSRGDLVREFVGGNGLLQHIKGLRRVLRREVWELTYSIGPNIMTGDHGLKEMAALVKRLDKAIGRIILELRPTTGEHSEPTFPDRPLNMLSRWAVVAVAARAARRVLPLYAIPRGTPDADRHALAVRLGVEIAERAAKSGSTDFVWDEKVKHLVPGPRAVPDFASEASKIARAGPQHDQPTPASLAAAVAADAAQAAIFEPVAAYSAVTALRNADDAVVKATGDESARVQAQLALAKDIMELQVLGLAPRAGNAPVPMKFFERPLWPDGPPPHWDNTVRVAREDIPKAPFVIVWDPDLIDDEQYARLVTLLGDVVRAHGGAGVERIREQTVGVPAKKGATV